MIKAKLIVVGGDAKRAEVNLKSLPATIGRAKDASITLPHSLVSRHHCEIYEVNDALFVKDLNSLNGTYLNNNKISDPTPLLSGQLLTLGNVTFRAVYDPLVQDFSSPVENDSEQASTQELENDDTIDVGVGPGLNSIPAVEEADTDHGKEPEKKKKSPAKKNLSGGRKVKGPVIFDEEIADADKSISVEAIADLPPASPQASFAGAIDLGSENQNNQVDESVIKIRTDENSQSDVAASQSSLNEFFRKLPK